MKEHDWRGGVGKVYFKVYFATFNLDSPALFCPNTCMFSDDLHQSTTPTLARQAHTPAPSFQERMRGVSLLRSLFFLAPALVHGLFWGTPPNALKYQYGIPRWRFLPFPNNPSNPGWLDAWEEVGEVVGDAPPQRLMLDWPNNVQIVEPNVTTSVGLMTTRPRLTWPAEAGALYTVMVIDAGIQRVLPKVYLHWMVTNIPGNSVELGNEVMEYVTPFSLEVQEDPLDGFIKDRHASAHPMIFLVFKQPGRIQVEETQRGCSPDIVSARIHDYEELASKYGLQLAAGNYLQCPWSGSHTLEMVCRVSKCTREAFPFPIPGVNDLEECKPRETIVDLTLVGPRINKWKEYAKYRSLLSLDSITSEIKNTYPEYSTGNVADFTNIEGAYNGAPIGTNNQPSTLEGVVDVTFLEYQNAPKTIEMFSKAAELFPSVGHLFPNLFAGGRPLKIILSKPYDQDWDFMTALDKPGMLMDINVVRVKDGREEDFQSLRSKVVAAVRNSKDVKYITTFDVERDLVAPSDPLYFDSTNNEIWISTFESAAVKERFFAGLAADSAAQSLLTRFFDTFECIVCSTATAHLHPTYYPPFP